MPFTPGLAVSRAVHDQVVAPLIAARFPGLAYAAARVDSGSDVLGLDTERSRDHDWGARLQVFLADEDASARGAAVADAIRAALPATVAGVRGRCDRDSYGVTVEPMRAWLRGCLGFEPDAGVTPADWLGLPTQRLAELTGGAVFHDGLGALTRARALLAWYPDDVWRYVLAAQWARYGEEEPFVGRCGELGDDLGGRVVAARLARDLMRLCVLLERRYPPYTKWLGTAFAALPAAGDVGEPLAAALAAGGWRARERHLVTAAAAAAVRTNATGLAATVDPTPRPFHDRPYTVLGAERHADALRGAVADPWLRALPLTGAVDQVADSTAVLAHTGRARAATRGLLDGIRPNDR